MENQLSSDTIIEEVEMVGFGAELLEMIEDNQHALMRQTQEDSKDDIESGQAPN